MRKLLYIAIFGYLVGLGTPSYALEIVLTDTTLGGSDPNAIAAFEAAANYWESLFSDTVTVRIDVSLENLADNVLGSTQIESGVVSYASVRDALEFDATSTDDTTAVSNLETGNAVAMITNNPDVAGEQISRTNSVSDSDPINSKLAVSQANLKALGFLAVPDSTKDATIKLNSDFMFDFDFDSSDGITDGDYDFIGIATHEIGHALGFISGVDAMDQVSEFKGPLRTDWTTSQVIDAAVFNTLDLYRYSVYSRDFLDGPILDWGFNDGVIGDAYFSIDGGTTDIASFSAGFYNSLDPKKYQASHWEEVNPTLGIMDPAGPPGELLSVLTLDLIAFDVIGWDLSFVTPIPEPASILLLSTGLLGFLARRKKTTIHDIEL